MRFSEATAIQVKNIYKSDNQFYAKINGSMIVRRGAPKGKRYVKSHSPKTTAGFRDVSLPNDAVKIYLKNAKGKLPDDFIFQNEDCRGYGHSPLRVNSANKLLEAAIDKQNIEKKVTTHFFRHTHVSKLAELGIPLYVIQRRVGHANGDITKQIYLHVTDTVKHEVAEKLHKFAPPVPHKDNDKRNMNKE